MSWFDPVTRWLLGFWRWLRTFPHLGSLALVIGVVVMLVCQMLGYHESQIPWMPSSGTDLLEVKDWPEPPRRLLVFYYVMPYLKLWALVGGVVYHIVLIRAVPNVEKLLWPTWIACGFMALWAVCHDLHDHLEFARLTIMGEPPSIPGYVLKLAMVVLVCLTPAIGLSYYIGSSLLDRYTFRSFLQPLIFCFVGICLLWIMWDMLDSLRDFQEAKIPVSKIAAFYLSLVPYIFVETIWAVLLLAALFTLSRMSRTNEIISMLGAGRSLGQVLRPVFTVAALISALSMAANYYWAPRAEGNRQGIMRALSESAEGSIMAESLMYRDEPNRRTWFIGSFPFSLREDRMKRVEVFAEDENGRLIHSLRAPTVMWWPDGRWSFYHSLEVTYQDGNPVEVIRHGANGTPYRRDIADWPETPWSIISSSLVPDFMSVQELVSYLKAHSALSARKLAAFRTHLAHRFAFPWLCLVAALVAAPLGISFSRRGVLGGIAGAIFFLGALLFFNQFFLSLGKGLRVEPWIAVWMPHVILGTAGGLLFYFRSRNRDLPKPSLARLSRLFVPRRKHAGESLRTCA